MNHSKSAFSRSVKTGTLRSSASNVSVDGRAEFSVIRVPPPLPARYRSIPSLNLGKILMDELNHDCPFANSGSHSLDGAVAHIADNKNSRHTGFEQAGITVEIPAIGPFPVAKKIRSGEDEPAIVALDFAWEPLCAGLRANEDEEARSGKLRGFAGGRVFDSDGGEPGIAMNFADASLRQDLDIRCRLNLLDEVVRHGAGKRVTTDKHHHFRGKL